MSTRVLELEAQLRQLQTQIATAVRPQMGPTATIPYKTTNFSGEEKECTKLAVNNWLHQWTTYFDLHDEPNERRILTIPLYLRSKALTWWRDMTEKPTTWVDFCAKFKKDFAKMDPLKAYAKLQSLTMKTLTFDKYATASKEALTFCKVDATHAIHMYLLGLHEDYRWALIKDKAPSDIEDAVSKARTFHLINGAVYEKKRATDHQSGDGTSKKRSRFQPKASTFKPRPSSDTTPRGGGKEKKKARNASIAYAFKHHLAHSSCIDCSFSTKVFDKHDLLRFPGKINGHDVSILLDNGSSHNFVDAKLVQMLHLPTRDSDHEYRVKMARGEDEDVWDQMVPDLQLEFADYKETLDFHIMRLDRADVILGIPWFYDKQDTLYIDYVHHSLVFVKQDMPHVSLSLCN
ncbi:hypothetical protein L7F22_066753 [Adiantum nelumboides]|nr:hypothetical protein [Adiantum nelumboides]